jgi:hypothetical protein
VPLQAKLEQLADPIEREFTAAKNHTADDLGEVLAKRKQLKSDNRAHADERRRRLIERVAALSEDKR